MSSVMHMTGDPDGPPQYVGNYIGDTNTGVHAALAVCAALFYRDRSGKGQRIDIAQVDSLFFMDMINVPLYALTNGEQNPNALALIILGLHPSASLKEETAISYSRRWSINSPNWQKLWAEKTW